MGDRTTVTLYVLKEHSEEALKLISDTPSYSYESDMLAVHEFDEINYGILDGVDDLEEVGIPYESDWAEGSEYSSGSKTLRFTSEGEPVIKEILDEFFNPPLSTLMALIEKPYELIKEIQRHHSAVSVLPWEGQLENSRVYKARKLFNPNI